MPSSKRFMAHHKSNGHGKAPSNLPLIFMAVMAGVRRTCCQFTVRYPNVWSVVVKLVSLSLREVEVAATNIWWQKDSRLMLQQQQHHHHHHHAGKCMQGSQKFTPRNISGIY